MDSCIVLEKGEEIMDTINTNLEDGVYLKDKHTRR